MVGVCVLLSIVIPYFNAGKYIYTAVQSILDACIQDAPYEIIIINDASDAANTARLHEIYQRCWASHSEVPVRIETLPENQGLSGARNHGIQIARGQYVFTLDADDYVNKKAFIKVLRDVKNLNMDMIFFGSYWYEKDHAWGMQGFKFEPKAEITVDQTVLASYITAQTFYAWRFIAKRELLLQVPYPPRLYMEDVATTTPLLSRAKLVWYEPDQVVYYRQNPNSIMKVWNEKKSMDFLTTVGMLRDRLQLTEPMGASLSQAYFGLTCKAYLWACADAIRHEIPDAFGACRRIKDTHIQMFGKIALTQWPKVARLLDRRQTLALFLLYYSPRLYQIALKAKRTLFPKK